MPQPLGDGGDLRIDADGFEYFLPLILSGARDAPAGQTTDRTYVNPRRNKPTSRTTAGGPGDWAFSYDKNASAAIQALRRAKSAQDTINFAVIANRVQEVVEGSANSRVYISAAAGGNPARAIFTGSAAPNLLSPEIDSSQFLLVGAAAGDYDIAYVIERIIDATSCYVHRVGPVAGAVGAQKVSPDETYTAATAITQANATQHWGLVIPAEVIEAVGSVSQLDGSTISEGSTEDTVVLTMQAEGVDMYYVDEDLNAPVDAS